MPTDENQKSTQISENRATTDDNELIFPDIALINTNCKVCNSGKLNEIHALRPHMTLRELSDRLKKDFDLDLDKDCLSRHFIHYAKSLKIASVKKRLELFEQETENVASHQKKTLFLMQISFDHIIDRLEAGTLQLGIDDFEKLVKLYYSVLRDPDSAGDENILAIFQRASEKFGCGLEQGVLLKLPKKEV